MPHLETRPLGAGRRRMHWGPPYWRAPDVLLDDVFDDYHLFAEPALQAVIAAVSQQRNEPEALRLIA